MSGQFVPGVFSLPAQQGPAFLGGQGGSFVGGNFLGQDGVVIDGQVFGQASPAGVFGQAGPAGAYVQQGGLQVGAAQGVEFGFASSIVRQQVTPTVTETVTVDQFKTLTDLVLHSVPVTQTQFTVRTTTRVTHVVSVVGSDVAFND